MNTRKVLWIAVLAAGIALCAQPATAQSATSVTGAGSAVLGNGATYNGVSLSSLKFGMGVALAAGNSATGDFESTLIGTSGGQPRTITVTGKPTVGSGKTGGSTTFSGNGTVNMGDGSPALTGVPFALTAVPSGGKGSLTLRLGSTTLPAATINAGSLTVR